jgi:hypothetical protein
VRSLGLTEAAHFYVISKQMNIIGNKFNLAPMFKWVIIGLSLLVCGPLLAQRNLALHDTFPVFQMQTLSGETYSNDSALQYPTIYIFWASWNAPSLELLDEIKQHYPIINPTRRGVKQIFIDVVDISIDIKSDIHRITVKREDWPWEQHLVDYKGWESSVLNALGINKIPTLIIVDKNKEVIVVDPDINQLRNILSNIKLNTTLSN